MRYRGFYDLPRLVAVEYRGCLYLLDSPFDDQTDDYADHYTVYRLPGRLVARLDDPTWADLPSAGVDVGRVSTADVEFDATKRQKLNDSLFERLDMARHA